MLASPTISRAMEELEEQGSTGVVSVQGARGTASVPVWYIEMDTPIGKLVVTSEGEFITSVYMESHKHGPLNVSEWLHDANEEQPVLRLARQQLAEYFEGTRELFELPLSARGTDVQKDVWRELSNIPYGETRSYGEIARTLGKPKASRAIGAANGRNPIPIVVPCHRVIGADGSLTGFGGGVERKEWLLTHEARVSGRPTKFGRVDLFSGAG